MKIKQLTPTTTFIIFSTQMKYPTKILGFIAAALACVFLTGCASIISGRHEAVTFTSSPDDALVTIDGKQFGKTPITAQLERMSKPQVVTISKDGYKTETFQLKSTVNGWFFGNLIFGGLLGSSTDSSTGAINEYAQNMFNFALTPAGASTLPANSEIKKFVIENYKDIIEELNTKPDSNLKALFVLMNIKPENQDNYIKQIKQLADENKDIVTFADKVAALAP
jgi:hypothetical protein